MTYKAPAWLLDNDLNNRPIDITVVGAGGTGGELMSRLFKMHHLLCKLGSKGLRVILVDDDVVTDSNVGRQPFFEFDVGRSKAAVLIERFNAYADLGWSYAKSRVDENNLRNFIGSEQFLITCVDNPQSRVAIGEALLKRQHVNNVLWIDAGNDANTAQVVFGTIENRRDLPFPRLPTVYDLYKEQLKTQPFKAVDSCSHEAAIAKQDFGINDTAAHAMGQLIWQLIRYGKLESHGAIIDMLAFSQKPLPIDPEIWAMFGYTAEI